MISRRMLIAALAVSGCIGGVAVIVSRSPASPRAQRLVAAERVTVAAAANEDRRIDVLTQELRVMKARLSAQPQPTVTPVPAAVSAEPERAVVAPLSAQERRERRIAFHSSIHEGETRSGRAASEFEAALSSAVMTNQLGGVDRVDCRSTVCVLEIRHAPGSSREDFERLVLYGPIRNGAFDYTAEDGRTIAYVAMPGHSLQSADQALQ